MNETAKIINDIVKSGNHDQYEILVERFSNLVFGTCVSILGSREDAADITQETFVKAYRILGDLRDAEKFPIWLKRIAVGMCKNLLRANSRRTNRLHNFAEKDCQHAPTEPDSIVSGREENDIVRRCISALPERYRTVIVLKYLEGLRYADIASFNGISERATKAIACEAKKLLLARLKKKGVINTTVLQTLIA